MAEFLNLDVGAVVKARGGTWQIEQKITMGEFRCVNLETRERAVISSGEFDFSEEAAKTPLTRPDIHNVSEEEWKRVEKQYEELQPLLTNPHRNRTDVEAFAAAKGIHPATVYRQIRRAQALGSAFGLVRRTQLEKRPIDFSLLEEGRVPTTVAEVVVETARKRIAAGKRGSDTAFCKLVVKRIRELGFPWVPHTNTVRAVMYRLAPKILMTLRKGPKAALSLDISRGQYAEKNRPYQVFQVDHTPLNVIVVDDEFREPIGRAVMTATIELSSRVVPGFGISLEHPSTASVSTAIRHAVLRKEQWLKDRGIKANWPIFGKPVAIHADNANEFRGDVLQRVCGSWDMNLIWRPVGKPEYGAFIERWLGTLATILQEAPGATFANPQQKLDYDSEGNALMTMDELEAWLTYQICKYHLDPHSELGDIAPLDHLQRALDGDEHRIGVGRPPVVQNERRLYLDFLPREHRVVTPEGVRIDYIWYRCDGLAPFIGTKDPQYPSESRKYPFAIDDRQISPIYMFDESTNDYIDVPYANPSRPQISAWERDKARQRLVNQGLNSKNEDEIFRMIAESESLLTEADKKTKTVRREAQKKKQRAKGKKADDALPSTRPAPAPKPAKPEPTVDDDDIPIMDVEDL